MTGIMCRKRICTPTCKGMTAPALTARDRLCATHMIDTGHYPKAAVFEVWKKRKS